MICLIERIRYGGVSNPYNYSEFTCDTAADIADLPTNKDIGKYKNLDTCSIGSKATVISDRTMYILNGNNQWVLLKDYKATGGGSSILIDETLTESGQAADAKAVGDKIAEVKESAHTHSNKDVLDEITSNKITAWDGYSVEIQTVKTGLVGKKDSNSPNSTGEVFNDYSSNKAIGKNSHAEGYNTKAIGENSHAEGNGTTASGSCSHAEGFWAIAASNSSHAEGANTRATGSASHAEGSDCIASGLWSHAEGLSTKASGRSSHAEGECTIAAGSCQHASGKYNLEDVNNKYAFIIGNGTDENNCSNAFAIDWDGNVYVGNSTVGVDVAALKESAHTHNNKETLDSITSDKITTWDSYSAEIEKINSMLVRKTIQFRHGKGTFTATATGTNVVWQYGGQQVQGDSCTFDVKSDNGLICMDFDSITSLSITSDAKNKMNLSDLGGKITNMLNLASCTNITGDLSDLGGKITSTLRLDGCTNITGDLSDLGGKITSTLNLNGCTNITGVYSGTKYPKTFAVSKAAITSADMDANLINFAASGVKSGTFTAIGMKRTAASDNAVATLVTNGWTVSGLTKEG